MYVDYKPNSAFDRSFGGILKGMLTLAEFSYEIHQVLDLHTKYLDALVGNTDTMVATTNNILTGVDQAVGTLKELAISARNTEQDVEQIQKQNWESFKQLNTVTGQIFEDVEQIQKQNYDSLHSIDRAVYAILAILTPIVNNRVPQTEV